MKTLISIIILWCCLISCTSDEGQAQFNYAVGFEFGVKDNEGNDLLNPENPHSFNENEIKLFYLTNENIEEVYDGNLDYPRNFLIFRQGDNYRIRVFVNHSGTDETTTTYIQWKETDTDTLNCKINRSNTLTKIDEVYLNEALIWSAASSTAPYFEIIK